MAKLPENKERRLQGLNQDVLAVSAPIPVVEDDLMTARPRRGQAQVEAPMASGRRSLVSWFALVIAILALLVALGQWQSQQTDRKELAQLRQQYNLLAAAQMQAREHQQTQPASGQEAPPAAAINGSALTSLRDDLRQLNGKVRGLTVSVAKLGGSSETDALQQRLDSLASTVKTLSARVNTLASQPQTATAAPVSAGKDHSAEIAALQGKVSRIDKDLQALYRILQGG